jgi:lipopolysaccharide transport system permease protein
MAIIGVGKHESLLTYFKEMWVRRELFVYLAWRDFTVRYKQSLIGITWALLRPLLTMTIFVIVFGYFVKVPSAGVPYPLLVCAGILPWQLFSNSFSDSSNSLIANSALISKVYFPRLLVPFSSVVVGFVDFMISCILLLILMVWYGVTPSLRLLGLPAFILLALLAAAAAGIWMSALTVKYRDFRHLSPFILQLGLYVSPVGFSSSIVPEKWQFLYHLNPMASVIDGFRWAVLNENNVLTLQHLAMATIIVMSLLITGIMFFRKVERTLADVI